MSCKKGVLCSFLAAVLAIGLSLSGCSEQQKFEQAEGCKAFQVGYVKANIPDKDAYYEKLKSDSLGDYIELHNDDGTMLFCTHKTMDSDYDYQIVKEVNNEDVNRETAAKNLGTEEWDPQVVSSCEYEIKGDSVIVRCVFKNNKLGTMYSTTICKGTNKAQYVTEHKDVFDSEVVTVEDVLDPLEVMTLDKEGNFTAKAAEGYLREIMHYSKVKMGYLTVDFPSDNQIGQNDNNGITANMIVGPGCGAVAYSFSPDDSYLISSITDSMAGEYSKQIADLIFKEGYDSSYKFYPNDNMIVTKVEGEDKQDIAKKAYIISDMFGTTVYSFTKATVETFNLTDEEEQEIYDKVWNSIEVDRNSVSDTTAIEVIQ